MKYKLINKQTNEEHLCDKVTIDGFDYYVSDDKAQIGENVLWIKQTYYGDKEYANYIGKVYTLKECFPRGKEIALKDFYPKKSLDEVRQSIITFLEKAGKQRTAEQIEENAIKNQATSGNLYLKIGYNISENDIKKVIATNNPNIDIPKVVDEIERLSQEYTNKRNYLTEEAKGFYDGYNKSQETHPFSEEDMIEFGIWCLNNVEPDLLHNRLLYCNNDKWGQGYKSKEELLQIWKEQQPKKVYYNE